MVYRDAGKNHFTLTKSNAETHNFGIAVVTMPNEKGVITAINILSGVSYVSTSSPMRL